MKFIFLYVVPLIVLGLIILWAIMLIHVIKSKIPYKIGWILVLLLGGPFVGGIVYYFSVYSKQNIKTPKRSIKA